MSSSSTAGRPFTGRLRSSTRPNSAHPSKDPSVCSGPSAARTQDGDSEPCPSRFSACRSLSASVGGQAGDAPASASPRGAGCRSVAASHPPPASRVSREASATSAGGAPCGLNHGSNDGGGVPVCRLLTAVGHVDRDATESVPEDKRAARRRRRAEAAAAAAAAALAGQKADETCGSSSEAASHAAPAALPARVHSHRSSARGRSGVEWKAELQVGGTAHKFLSSCVLSSACLLPGESNEQSRLPPEASSSASGGTPLHGAEGCGGDAGVDRNSGHSAHCTTAVLPSSSLSDGRTSHAVEGSGVSAQGSSGAADTVAACTEAGAVSLAAPAGTPAVPQTAGSAVSASNELRVTAERASGRETSALAGSYSLAESAAAGSSGTIDGAACGEHASSGADISVSGDGSAAAAELPSHGGSSFTSTPEHSTAETVPFLRLSEGEERTESNVFAASGPKRSGTEGDTTTSGDGKTSTFPCSANSTASCSYHDSAKLTECSSLADSSVAVAAEGSEGLLIPGRAVKSKSLLRHTQECFSASEVASESSLKGEVRRQAQIRSCSGDGAQHVDETVTVPCSLLQCSSTLHEKAEQFTSGGGAPSAAGESEALLRDTPVVVAAEVPTASCITSAFHLTPVVHGLQCSRGQLLLNGEEFEALQSFLRPLFYRFVPCASASECLPGYHDRISRLHYTCGGLGHKASVGCSPVPLRKEGKPSSRRLAQELHALQQAACAFAALPPRGSKRRREAKLKDFPDDEVEVGSATYSSSHSSGGSFCSIGTHRRDHEGVGEDGEGSKGGDSLSTQEHGGRRQQQRSRKLTLRVDEDVEGEEGAVDTIKGCRRSQRMGFSAGGAFERVEIADSDGDVSSAVSGPSRRRLRGECSSSWKRRKSIEKAGVGLSMNSTHQSLQGERQAGRGSSVWEGRVGKGSYAEVEGYVDTGNTREAAARRSDSKAHRRRRLPEENGCEGFHRLKRNEYDGNVEETETRMYGSRRLWGGKQKKGAGGTVPLSGRRGGNDTGNTFDAQPYTAATASSSSPLLYASSTPDWRESCYLILQHLKRQPSARWFLSQECDALSGYSDPSTQRLSLQEIEQKLTSITSPKITDGLPTSKNIVAVPTASRGRGYVHPSEWQQEVRQIFFNAFTIHPMYQEIWRDAAVLAAEFERCCRLVHEVNPYYPAMLKHQRSSSRACTPGAAGRSTASNCVSGVSGAPTVTTMNNIPQLTASYVGYGGPPVDASAKAADGVLHVGGTRLITGTPQERVSLVHSEQVHLSQSDPSNFRPQNSARLPGSAPCAAAAAVVASGPFSESSAALGYAPVAPLLRGGCGKQHGNTRTGRAGGDAGVRGKRQQQHEAGASEGQAGAEDVDVIRKLDGSLVYTYGRQYREMRGALPGDEGGKNSRVVAAAAGSPRRGGRGGGRGRGTTRGGRGVASTNELHGSAPPQPQLLGRHPWTGIGGQGVGMVPDHGFLRPLGDLQQQAFTSGGRLLPVGIGAGGQPTNDGAMMLLGAAGVPAGGGFTAGATVPGTGASANVLLLSSSNVLDAVQQMEAPVGAPVLPPPPVPRIGVNDKPLSSSQRRTLEQNMQRLSPMQRKAALELIQDDLGILAAEYMNVKAFAFDTELLSIEKQKRLFAYVNSMFRANREILLRQHQQQVAAAQATAMSVAADGAAEALQQQSRGGRRGRRKRGERGIAEGMRGSQTRSGSSSSSSGSDTDSSSSLSSSDSSSSTSSSDTEEEESEGSENDSEYCQKASSSATRAASEAAHPAAANGALSSTDTGSGKTGTEAGPQGISTALRGREQFSEKTAVSSVRAVRGGGGEEQESGNGFLNDSADRTAGELNFEAAEARTRFDVAEVTVEGGLQATKGVTGSSEIVSRHRIAEAAESSLVTGTARQTSDYFESESPGESRFCFSSTFESLSPGNRISRENNQGEITGVTRRDSCGPLSFHSACSDSPRESGAGLSSRDPTPVSASSHAMTKRPGSRAACSTKGDQADATGDKNASEDVHRMTGRFLGSCGATVASKTSVSGGRTLPQYTPVCEEGAGVEIRAEVMGRHADFLGMLDVREAGGPSENEGARMSDCGAKPTAWQEWKGQVIQQGFVAQRAYASQQQRSVSEIIAEGYNARI